MRDTSIAEFSGLVESIYDCALDLENWRAVLPRIAAFLDSDGSTFAIYDMANSASFRFYDHGLSEEAVQSYFATYATLNPTLEAKTVFKVGEPYTLRMVIDEEELSDSRFYKEWMRPNRQSDAIGVTALRSGTRMATHAVNQMDHRPNYSRKDLDRYRLLVPHISRSLTIANVLELKPVTSEALDLAFDKLHAAVFLVSETGGLLHVNASGRDLLSNGDVVMLSNGRIVARDLAAAAKLLQAIRSAGGKMSDEWSAPTSIAMPNPSGQGYLATVLPLLNGKRSKLGKPFSATVAVFVQRASKDAPLPGEALAELYRLTAAELRVALASLLATARRRWPKNLVSR